MKKDVKNLTNRELEKMLHEADYCDRELLKEYDERCHDGRIQFKPIPMNNIEEFIKSKYAEKRRKKAS